MTITPTITTDSFIAAHEGVVSCDLDDEVVLLHLHSGTYFGLNPVGVDIWSRIQNGERVSGILDYLLTQYDVERDVCLAGLLGLIRQLAENGLASIDQNEAHS